jgi:hypothetical protein
MRMEEGGDVVEAKLKTNFLIWEVMNVVHKSTRFSCQSIRKLQGKSLKVWEPMILKAFGIPANMAKLSFNRKFTKFAERFVGQKRSFQIRSESQREELICESYSNDIIGKVVLKIYSCEGMY